MAANQCYRGVPLCSRKEGAVVGGGVEVRKCGSVEVRGRCDTSDITHSSLFPRLYLRRLVAIEHATMLGQ